MSRKVVVDESLGLSLSERFGKVRVDQQAALTRKDVSFTRPTNQGVTKTRNVTTNTIRNPGGRGVVNGRARGLRGVKRGFGEVRAPSQFNQNTGNSRRGGTNRGRSGTNRGRGGRTRGRGKKVLDANSLDKELTSYMLKDEKFGANMLDNELDEYMKGRDNEDK